MSSRRAVARSLRGWGVMALVGLAHGTPQRPPNLVVIFTDDQGWADIGTQGAQGFETPHLDALASEGVRCSNFYVAQPVCSASRAALLTGCYSNRVGISGALGPSSKIGISDSEQTLAELSKQAGHATAIFGKWHLGHRPQFLPQRHGFDEFYGIPYSNDMWPFHPENPTAWGDLPTLEGDRVVGFNTDQTRFTGDFTARAVSFIERNADKPFFLYLAHPMPHVPLHASADYVGQSEQGLYGDVIEEIDASVGAVVDALERTGNTGRTLVIYTSDNGPWLSYGNHAGSTGPLREGKGSTFEGGVRVPCIWRWPGQLPAGSVCATPLMTIDVLPTWAGRLGQPLGAQPIDGVDVWKTLMGEEPLPERPLFFYYGNNELQAMRRGRWKLHLPHGYRSMGARPVGVDGQPGKYDYAWKTGLELYDLSTDIGESMDLATSRPRIVETLLDDVLAMRAELGDRLTSQSGTQRRAPGRVTADK